MDINQVIIGNPTSVKFFYQSTGISVMNEKCGEVGYILRMETIGTFVMP